MIDADDFLVGDLVNFEDGEFLTGNTHFHGIAVMGRARQLLEPEGFEKPDIFIQVPHDQFDMVNAAYHFSSLVSGSMART